MCRIIEVYPYDVWPFLDEDVFPFVISFFKPSIPDSTIALQIIQTIVTVIAANLFGITKPVFKFLDRFLPEVITAIFHVSNASMIHVLLCLVRIGAEYFIQFGCTFGVFTSKYGHNLFKLITLSQNAVHTVSGDSL